MNTFTQAGSAPAFLAPAARRGMARAWHDHAGMIAGATAGAALCGAIYAWSLPAVYQADVLVRPETGKWSGQGEAPAAPATSELRPDALTSRAVLTPVVRESRLDIVSAPRVVPVIGPLWARLAGAADGEPLAPPLGLAALSGYAWGGERIDVLALNVPEALLNQPLTLVALGGGEFRLERADGTMLLAGQVGDVVRGEGVSMKLARLDARADTRFTLMRRDPVTAYDLLAGGLRVEAQPGTAGAVAGAAGAAPQAVRIAWRDGDPARAAAVVNAVAHSISDTEVGQRREQADQQLDFITGELPRVRAQLEQAEAALARYRARAGSMQPAEESKSYLSGSIDYQKQISALRIERARLLRKYTPESQEVQAVDDQLQQLASDRRNLDTQRKGLTEAERESASLTRDVKVAEDTYMALRRQAQALALAQSDRTSDVRLVDFAMTPALPVGPQRGLLTALAALLGLLAGAGVAGYKGRARQGMDSAPAIESTLALPMVGEVVFSPEQAELERRSHASPRSLIAPTLLASEQPQAMYLPSALHGVVSPAPAQPEMAAEPPPALHDRYLLARQYPHAPAVEGLRTLRAALHFAMDGAANHIVAITSASAGAGKTFGAVNLAALAAEAGMRVLLVDADLRRARVAGQFGLEGMPGLADLLCGTLALHDAIRPTAVPGLWLLAAGTRPVNPSELLMLPALRELLLTCDAGFDLILVDTPPILAVADAALVGRLAGSTLLFVRADCTPQEKVTEALKQLERARANVIGGVLNGLQLRRSNRERCGETTSYLRATPQEEPGSPGWRIC
ncbi:MULTISPECIES: polysaccharide biosynthesis tyrosine autokinase [Cupriavidus]